MFTIPFSPDFSGLYNKSSLEILKIKTVEIKTKTNIYAIYA
jgi:hypothetical protein